LFGEKSSSSLTIAILFIILLGFLALTASIIYVSSFFAIIGLSLAFWGAILLYLMPTNSKFTLLLNGLAETASSNIEQILKGNLAFQKGVYVLKNDNAPVVYQNNQFEILNLESIVFFPRNQRLKNDDSKVFDLRDGLSIKPPGNRLCEVLERQIGRQFSKITFNQFVKQLPIVLRDLKIVESAEITCSDHIITVKIRKNAFDQNCQETDKNPLTHKYVGCLLSSAIACALLKVTSQPVRIKSETRDAKTRITLVQYTYGFGE
jgi:hypothetical protein